MNIYGDTRLHYKDESVGHIQIRKAPVKRGVWRAWSQDSYEGGPHRCPLTRAGPTRKSRAHWNDNEYIGRARGKN